MIREKYYDNTVSYPANMAHMVTFARIIIRGNKNICITSCSLPKACISDLVTAGQSQINKPSFSSLWSNAYQLTTRTQCVTVTTAVLNVRDSWSNRKLSKWWWQLKQGFICDVFATRYIKMLQLQATTLSEQPEISRNFPIGKMDFFRV